MLIQTFKALYNIHVQLIFYKLKEKLKRRFHVKSSVKCLKCDQVRTCCQSNESIFIDRQLKLNHILLYIHLWMDGHSLKIYEILYVISIVLSDMDLWRTVEPVIRWGASFKLITGSSSIAWARFIRLSIFMLIIRILNWGFWSVFLMECMWQMQVNRPVQHKTNSTIKEAIMNNAMRDKRAAIEIQIVVQIVSVFCIVVV